MAVCVRTEAEGSEPSPGLLERTGEEGVPIPFRHFGLASNAKLKHIMGRFLFHVEFGLLDRLLFS